MTSAELMTIAGQYQTPMYVFDMDEFDARISFIKKHLGERAEFCYAMKANPMLLSEADKSVSKFEVCSPGEFDICLKTGIAPEKIVYSGVYKDPVSTKKAVDILAGAGCVTAESPGQLSLIEKCSADSGKKTDVLLRVTSGNQFGIGEEEVRRIIKERSDYGHLNITGFQLYTGTQKRRIRTIEKELGKLDSLIAGCERDYGFKTEAVEYGPGLPVNYFEDDSFDEDGMLKAFSEALQSMKWDCRVTVEMGRFAASSCGYYLTSAGDIKFHKDANIIITDGGSHQFKYFGQNMGMRIPFFEHLHTGNPEEEPSGTAAGDHSEEKKWDVYGALCTVHDIIARELPLKAPRAGDVFVFRNTGAYSVTEGMSLFLSRDLPLILSYSRESGARIMRERLPASDINCPI